MWCGGRPFARFFHHKAIYFPSARFTFLACLSVGSSHGRGPSSTFSEVLPLGLSLCLLYPSPCFSSFYCDCLLCLSEECVFFWPVAISDRVFSSFSASFSCQSHVSCRSSFSPRSSSPIFIDLRKKTNQHRCWDAILSGFNPGLVSFSPFPRSAFILSFKGRGLDALWSLESPEDDFPHGLSLLFGS